MSANLTGKFYKHLQKNLYQFSISLSRKQKQKEHNTNYFYEVSINLITNQKKYILQGRKTTHYLS